MDAREVIARGVSAQSGGHALGFSEVVRVGENNEVARRLRRGIVDGAFGTLFERPRASERLDARDAGAEFLWRLCRHKEENPLMLGDRSLCRSEKRERG